MEEIVLSAVRAAMMSVKAPSAYDKVYKVRPVVFIQSQVQNKGGSIIKGEKK